MLQIIAVVKSYIILILFGWQSIVLHTSHTYMKWSEYGTSSLQGKLWQSYYKLSEYTQN